MRPYPPWASAILAASALSLLAGLARADDFNPPGQLVKAGPELLHLVCAGAGEPTVILESGLGGNYLDWTFVQPLVAAKTQTCSYDRAGMGFSAPATRPRTLDNLAGDLDALLAAAGIRGPLVLAGHSYGGMLVMHFARLHPDRVRGLVLVDSMHPDQFSRFEAAGAPVSTDPNLVLGRTHPAAAAYGLPAGLQKQAIWLATETKSRKAVIGEFRLIQASLGQAETDGFPKVPARVLVHGDGAWNQVYPDGRMEAAWTDMQEDLARRLGAPPPVVVPGTGHQVQLDAPRRVADAIEELLIAKAP